MNTKLSAHHLNTDEVMAIVPKALEELGYPGFRLNQLVEFTYQYDSTGYSKIWVVRGRFDRKRWFSTGIRKLGTSWRSPSDSNDKVVPFPVEMHQKLITFAAKQAQLRVDEDRRYEEERKRRLNQRNARTECLEYIGVDPGKLCGKHATSYTDGLKVSLRFEYTKENMLKVWEIRDALKEFDIDILQGLMK